MSLATPPKIRSLQRKLYVKAKKEPTFRFYSLFDKMGRPDVLAHAYRLAKSRHGAPGVDRETFEHIESRGMGSWLERLREDLRSGRYRPDAVRRVYIPKPGGGERPLGIPTIRDRVAQTAAHLVLSPIFEAEFGEEMYGYRPRRSAQGAVAVVHEALRAGYTDVVDVDLSKYFDTIPHADLLQSVARRVSDGTVLHLLRQWLRSPVEEEDETGRVKRTGGRDHTTGTTAGRGHLAAPGQRVYEPLSPSLAGAGHDTAPAREGGQLRGRFRDSLSRDGRAGPGRHAAVDGEPEADVERGEDRCASCTLGLLRLSWVHLRAAGTSVHRPTGRTYLAARPSRKAVARLRDRVREILATGNTTPWPEVVAATNRVLRGWQQYFSYGSVTRAYWWVDAFVLQRARGFLARRHKVSGRGTRRFPAHEVFGDGGLISLGAVQRAVRSHA